jgi:hypothetical protein
VCGLFAAAGLAVTLDLRAVGIAEAAATTLAEEEPATGEGVAMRKHVWHIRYRTTLVGYSAVMTAFFLGAASFGSQAPGLAGVLAVLCAVWTADLWRRGLYAEPWGVKIILAGRLVPRRFEWSDIDRFEARFAAGQSPVTLIRAPDQQPIAVPTFARLRSSRGPQIRNKYRAKVQAQVDELNQLLAQHRQASA